MTEMKRIEKNILHAQNQIYVRSPILLIRCKMGFLIIHLNMAHCDTDFLNIQCSQVFSLYEGKKAFGCFFMTTSHHVAFLQLAPNILNNMLMERMVYVCNTHSLCLKLRHQS